MAMSREDVQTLQKAYDAFNRADIPAVMEAMHSEIRWTEPGGGRAPGGTFNGPESVANDVFATVPENFDQFRADAEEWIDAVNYLAVVGHFHGHSKSGTAVDVPFVHLWSMRDGKAAGFENVVDQGAWTKAWGG
jgi:ketosteroid isomerase-like protein